MRLPSLDAFAKTVEDARVRTASGGLVTLLSLVTILWLSISEWIDYRRIEYRPQLVVDRARGERLKINLDITFPQMPCDLVTMDVMDSSGEVQEQVSHGIVKTRLDRNGKELGSEALVFERESEKRELERRRNDPDYCGSCYGAADGCCNTCEEVRQAYVAKGWAFHDGSGIEQCEQEHYKEKLENSVHEGCRIAGHVSVNKVVGNFHFAPGAPITQQNMHFHDISFFRNPQFPFTLSHTINHLSFGPEPPAGQELPNPLDGTVAVTDQKGFNYQYFIKVVATRFETLAGDSLETNQYAVTSHERSTVGGRDEDHPHTLHSHGGVPGVYFNYDISPMKVINQEQRMRTLGSFLTGVCAIIGGVLTVGAVIDRGVWEADKVLKRKKQA